MNIGERVVRHPITCYAVPPRPDFARPREGTIVYIHPQGRYHTVEFEDESGRKFRESFSKYDLVPSDTYYDSRACFHPDEG